MSLRAKLIEAGAEALVDGFQNRRPFTDEKKSEAVLDAFLDCLAENADEWIDVTGPLEWHDWSERAIVSGLIAVLRESDV